MNLDEAKGAICSYIDEISDELITVSHAIHANPELGYEEHFAHELTPTNSSESDALQLNNLILCFYFMLSLMLHMRYDMF